MSYTYQIMMNSLLRNALRSMKAISQDDFLVNCPVYYEQSSRQRDKDSHSQSKPKVKMPKCASDLAKHFKGRNSVHIKSRQLPTVNQGEVGRAELNEPSHSFSHPAHNMCGYVKFYLTHYSQPHLSQLDSATYSDCSLPPMT